MRRKEERSKQGQTNKAKQHSTPKAVTFPKKSDLSQVGLELTTCTCTCTCLSYLSPSCMHMITYDKTFNLCEQNEPAVVPMSMWYNVCITAVSVSVWLASSAQHSIAQATGRCILSLIVVHIRQCSLQAHHTLNALHYIHTTY